jgi:hypothetical protein
MCVFPCLVGWVLDGVQPVVVAVGCVLCVVVHPATILMHAPYVVCWLCVSAWARASILAVRLCTHATVHSPAHSPRAFGSSKTSTRQSPNHRFTTNDFGKATTICSVTCGTQADTSSRLLFAREKKVNFFSRMRCCVAAPLIAELCFITNYPPGAQV